MNRPPRLNTLACSVVTRQSPLYHALQSFFDNSIVESFVHAAKTGGKKNKVFLAVLLVVKVKEENHPVLYQVKKLDSIKSPFQVKAKYEISKLRLVNGLSEGDNEVDIELAFERGSNHSSPFALKWSLDTPQTRRNFLISLWKLCTEHLTNLPQFLNINYNLLQDSLSLSQTLKQAGLLGSPVMERGVGPEAREYKYLTGEEEHDLGLVTQGIDWSVESAEDFMERLLDELSGLTKANIHSIMSVETEVVRLFNIMDHALHELCRLEDIMVDYEDRLNTDRALIEETLIAYQSQHVRNGNRERLQGCVTGLTELIAIPDESRDLILSLPLKTAAQVSRIREAVDVIQGKMEGCRSSPLAEMACVTEAAERMEDILRTFSNRLFDTMSEITSPNWNAAQYIRHSKLTHLTLALDWLHGYDRAMFDDLAGRYVVTAQTTYQKVLEEYFSDKRAAVTKKSADKLLSKFSSNPKKSELAISQKMMSSSNLLSSQISVASNTSLDSVTSGRSSDHELLVVGQGGNQFEALVRDALDFTETSMEKEEQFVEGFFRATKSARERRELVEMVLCRFGSEWDDFVHSSCKFDIYYSLPIYLSLLDKLDNLSRESIAFAVFRKNLDGANEYFNKMYKQHKAKILEANKKCVRGTLASVLHFTQFLLFSESLQRNTKRNSIDQCYTQLSSAVSESVDSFAGQHSKLPEEVVVVENYHYLYNFLLKNKIESLDKYRSQCHRKYKDSLEQYIKRYLTLPLEKINVFFCGVQNKLDSGVRVTEIGFDPEFSKQKLKALIAEYSVKELKKGVESVMKKIEKHFSKDKNLFTVACLTVQAELIKQVEGHERLMRDCYPEAGLNFNFSVAQIHGIFDRKSPK